MSKFNIILIGTLAIGMFALPGVVSTFTGSHEYIAPENVDCVKCHDDVHAELLTSVDEHTHAGYTTTGEIWTLSCTDCHDVSGIGDNPAGGHAAQKVDCGFCHNKTAFGGSPNDYTNYMHGLQAAYDMECYACHDYDTPGMPTIVAKVYTTITDPDAAHYQFYTNAVNDTTYLLGGTESCVGCHTHVEFTITQSLGRPNMTYDPQTGKFDRED